MSGPRPGVDYAVTDIVRCKSRKGEGANEALAECSGRYLRRTIEASGARVLVGLGKPAGQALATYFGVPAVLGAHPPTNVGGCERILVLLGAPGSAQPRRLATEQERIRVQKVLT